MKQIFKTNLGIRVKDVPISFPNDNEVLVKVFNSLISVGTEANSLKAKSWEQKREIAKVRVDKLLNLIQEGGLKMAYGKVIKTLSNSKVESKFDPIGYSNSGVIVAKGKNVLNLNVGDRVACGGNTFATHAEMVTVPSNLIVRIPDNVTFEEAAFTTVGSIAMQGLRRSDVKPGEWIIVYGVGLLGLLAVQIAKSWGLHVIAMDLNNDKLEIAKSFRADVTINLTENKKFKSVVNSVTNGFGADASIIYASTTSSAPVNNSFDLCREKANIVIVGAVGMNLIRDNFYRKEQNLIISTSYGPGRYDEAYEIKGNDYPIGYVRWTENRNMQEFVSLLSSKSLSINALLTSTHPIENASKIYQKLASPLNDEVGVLFSFNKESKEDIYKTSEPIQIHEKVIGKNEINIGVIGAGSYIKNYILPYIKNSPNFNLIGLSNKTSKSSLEVGKLYDFNYITGDYKDLLKDSRIDLIIIGTRHDLHAKITMEALEANKNVFVEKPLSLTLEEIQEIMLIKERTSARFFVGFNRRYSGLIQELKSKLLERESPVMINYRVNAGQIPSNSWVQDPNIGGGRIIGEACHFIDLCNYIIENEILSFEISSVPINNKNIYADDNFILMIKYQDGSMASIFYSSIGGSKQPKELLEVYWEGESYVIEDFMHYSEFSNTDKKVIQLKEQDKGRESQIKEVLKVLQGRPSLIPSLNFDINASLLSIYSQERLYGKG